MTKTVVNLSILGVLLGILISVNQALAHEVIQGQFCSQSYKDSIILEIDEAAQRISSGGENLILCSPKNLETRPQITSDKSYVLAIMCNQSSEPNVSLQRFKLYLEIDKKTGCFVTHSLQDESPL